LSNGFAEAINGRIQAAKAQAKGYGTDDHLITISYLICANLKHLSKSPWLNPADCGVKVNHPDREREPMCGAR